MLKIHTVAIFFIGKAAMHVIKKGLPHLSETHSYNVRNKSNYSLETHHLTSYERKPSHIQTKLFNKLPQVLKQQADSKPFKNNLM